MQVFPLAEFLGADAMKSYVARMNVIEQLDERARQIFRQLVETYLLSGEPVGSRTLSRDATINASAATIRNVMADLTELGLLDAPHISAGRLPTELGLRLFIDGLMEIGDLSDQERRNIEDDYQHGSVEAVLEQAAHRLSGLTASASLVLTEKTEAPLRHLEFVPTRPGEALAVLVFENGDVENRVVKLPAGLLPSSLVTASNYLNNHMRGRTLNEARARILQELENNRAALDALTQTLVKNGVAELTGPSPSDASLIVRGAGRLLDEAEQADLERVRMLFDDIEHKEGLIDVLGAAREGQGVKIFIGSENRLFSLSGSSVIVAPYRDSQQNIVGVLGVIGPTRLNYARVIPIVDYTAEVVSRLLK